MKVRASQSPTFSAQSFLYGMNKQIRDFIERWDSFYGNKLINNYMSTVTQSRTVTQIITEAIESEDLALIEKTIDYAERELEATEKGIKRNNKHNKKFYRSLNWSESDWPELTTETIKTKEEEMIFLKSSIELLK
jgi:hypothetical protein